MKTLYYALILLVCTTLFRVSYAQSTNAAYDSTLAKKLKADEYGMKKYVLVLLKTGSATHVEKAKRDSLFAGHMQNIGRLADEGKLAVAGPFFTNDKYRGLFILDAASIEEAGKLVETDPAVKAKLLEPEFLLWYGSAALGEIPEIHKKLGKKSM